MEDRYGNAVTTNSAAARDAYVEGVDAFLAAQSGVEEAFNAAVAADDGFALAHLGLARFKQVAGQGPAAAEHLKEARAKAIGLTERESGLIAALGSLIDGDPSGYANLRAHINDFPRDAMAVQTCVGVFGLIGFSGQAGREAELLAFTSALVPHYGDDWWFLSQHAFAQVESGQVGPAEANITRAIDSNPNSANTAHIRAHIYYEQGEPDAGYKYLSDWRVGFDKSAIMHCHISWHVALWALAKGDVETMWQIIDDDIDPRAAWGPALNVLSDMAAILFRAELMGVPVPVERWKIVSEYAAKCFPQPGIAFADVHAGLAHAMAGDTDAFAKIVSDAKGPAGDLVRMMVEAYGAIAANDWSAALQHLAGAMPDHERIGGSRAQRDLLEYTMALVLLKLGHSDEARRMLAMRRPTCAKLAPVQSM